MLNREQIEAVIPHRKPMLLIDIPTVPGPMHRRAGDEFFFRAISRSVPL